MLPWPSWRTDVEQLIHIILALFCLFVVFFTLNAVTLTPILNSFSWSFNTQCITVFQEYQPVTWWQVDYIGLFLSWVETMCIYSDCHTFWKWISLDCLHCFCQWYSLRTWGHGITHNIASDKGNHFTVKGKHKVTIMQDSWGHGWDTETYQPLPDSPDRWPFKGSEKASCWWVYNLEMGSSGMYVKPTAIHAASALFPITKIHKPGNQKGEIGMPFSSPFPLIHLGNLGFHLCSFRVCGIREPASQRQTAFTRELNKDFRT